MEVPLLNKDLTLLMTPIGGRKNEYLLVNIQLYKDSLSLSATNKSHGQKKL